MMVISCGIKLIKEFYGLEGQMSWTYSWQMAAIACSVCLVDREHGNNSGLVLSLSKINLCVNFCILRICNSGHISF